MSWYMIRSLKRLIGTTVGADLATDVKAVGQEADAAATAVNTTTTLVSYVKPLVQESLQRAVPKIVQDQTPYNTYSNVVNITDKGVLTGIFQTGDGGASGGHNGSLKVVIDGVTVLDGVTTRIVGESATSFISSTFSLNCQFRFSTSLQVQHQSSQASNAYGYVYTTVAYTTD